MFGGSGFSYAFDVILAPLEHTMTEVYVRLGARNDNVLDGRCSIPCRGNDGTFPLSDRVQTGSGAHSASYPTGTEGTFPGDKAAGA